MSTAQAIPPASSSDERSRVLRQFFRDGRLTAIPVKQKKLRIVLDEIARAFDPAHAYPEAAVNRILQAVHPDHCALRRALVDFGYLTREHGIYRVVGPATGIGLTA